MDPPRIPPKLRDDHDTKKFSILAKIINGAISDFISITCVFPLDLVKTRLQNQQIGPNGEKMYKTLFDCFRQIYQAEGFTGMYRGYVVNIASITPELAVNDYFRHRLTTKDGKLPVSRQMVAGGLAGTCQIIVTTPMELLKIQLQDSGRVAAQAGKKIPKKSATQIALQLLKQKGLIGLYKGFSATMLRDVSFSICFFPLCATLNEMASRKSKSLCVYTSRNAFCAGVISGAVAALIVTPFDVVKTRLQAQALERNIGDKIFKGNMDCLIKTLRHEGFTALYKGGLCRVIVNAPLFGISQMIYRLNVSEWFFSIK